MSDPMVGQTFTGRCLKCKTECVLRTGEEDSKEWRFFCLTCGIVYLWPRMLGEIPTPSEPMPPTLLDVVAAWAVATIRLRKAEVRCEGAEGNTTADCALRLARGAARKTLEAAEAALLAAVGAA